MILIEPTPLPCSMVNNLTKNSIEQCKFIIDNNCLEDEATIDYVYLVYCEFGQEFWYLSIGLIVFLVIFLFLALSAIADEFLCPSLLAVAKNLRMSDSLAGVTLLAFGNGCPDIFSSLAAASDDRPELIVGELLGAGIFCTSIVSGLIFIKYDFKIACRPILRDTTFYLLALYLIWTYCCERAITFYGSLAFILIYVIYLIVALSGQAIHSRLQGDYAIAEKQLESQTEEERAKNEDWFQWRDESLRRRKLAKEAEAGGEMMALSGSASTKLRIHYVDGVTSIHLGSDSLKRNTGQQTEVPMEHRIYSSISNIKNAPSGGGHINKAFCMDTEFSGSSSEVFKKAPGSKQIKSSPFQQVVKIDPLANKRFSGGSSNNNKLTLGEWDEFLSHINPIGSLSWHEAKLTSKIFAIIRLPLFFAALITIPVVDYDRKYNNWCRLLHSIHCITVPLTITLSTNLGDNIYLFSLPLPALVILPGILMAIFVMRTTSAFEPPKCQAIVAYVGFVMSILWIYLLATEIISLLKTVGIMFSMSDTAIGLGVLAWGNSLGDIVANISLAEAGYPRMAIGASIGAPLLNLLLGFGLSFTLSLKPGQSSAFEYSPMITLLCSTLAIILLSLMLSTLTQPEKSKRPFGYLLIACYGVYFCLAICLEYGIIKF